MPNGKTMLTIIRGILEYAKANSLMTLIEANKFIECQILGEYRACGFKAEGFRHTQGMSSASRARVSLIHALANTSITWSRHASSIRGLSNIDSEAETLTQSGQQQFALKTDKMTIAIALNTPLLEKRSDYDALRAVQFAYDKYLCNALTDSHISSADLSVFGIVRPNHGLPHTLATMEIADGVIAYFGEHSSDPELSEFCLTISATMRTKIKTALAFFVTGRESETSRHEHVNIHQNYKRQSAENFANYATQIDLWDTKEIIRFKTFIVRAPTFLFMEKEDQCIHDIITLSHTLHLPRCYSATDMNTALLRFSAIIQQSYAAEKAWIELKKWADAIILATGDRLFCKIGQNGLYEDYHSHYDSTKFVKNSKCPYTCLTTTRSVPLPYLRNKDVLEAVLDTHLNALLLSNDEKECQGGMFEKASHYLIVAARVKQPEDFRIVLDTTLARYPTRRNFILALLAINEFYLLPHFFIALYSGQAISDSLHQQLAERFTDKMSQLILFDVEDIYADSLSVTHHLSLSLKSFYPVPIMPKPFVASVAPSNMIKNCIKAAMDIYNYPTSDKKNEIIMMGAKTILEQYAGKPFLLDDKKEFFPQNKKLAYYPLQLGFFAKKPNKISAELKAIQAYLDLESTPKYW